MYMMNTCLFHNIFVRGPVNISSLGDRLVQSKHLKEGFGAGTCLTEGLRVGIRLGYAHTLCIWLVLLYLGQQSIQDRYVLTIEAADGVFVA